MKLLDAILGRPKQPRSHEEDLLALATAGVSLETQLGLRSTGRGGLALRPVSASAFEATEDEMRRLLETGAREDGSSLAVVMDAYGYLWVVVHDEQLEDIVSSVYAATIAMADGGFRDQILAALFEFERDGKKVCWVYNFKRARFYPFLPLPAGQRRDNAEELRFAALMKEELPLEEDVSHWYGLWGAPLGAAGEISERARRGE